MGAYSVVHALDVAALTGDVAPALRRLVTRAPGDAPPWLDELLAQAIADAQAWEARAPERGDGESRGLRRLRAGLGVAMFGACELRADLAIRDDDARLLAAAPSIHGGCASTTCAGATACPVHPAGAAVVRAEPFMELVKAAFARCCRELAVIGRHGDWHALQTWHALEHGLACWDDAELADQVRADRTLALLLRLARRGAIVGWGDGGFGEGLLGWLDAAETAELAPRLRALPTAIPAALADDTHAAEVELPRLRAVIATLADAAAHAVDAGLGLALTRH